MIFVDSNIPMYLIGADHPHKEDSRRLLEECALRGDRLVTDAEVFQEILHRYLAIRRLEWLQPAFGALRDVVEEVYPIELRDVDVARSLAEGGLRMSARDAIHAAVMRRYGITRIMSFDGGFDDLPGLTRLS